MAFKCPTCKDDVKQKIMDRKNKVQKVPENEIRAVACQIKDLLDNHLMVIASAITLANTREQ